MDGAGIGWGTVAGIGILLFVAYLAVAGLVIGALARWLLPGPDPMSYPRTILFGLGGSLVGGLAGRLLGISGGLDFLLGIAGAMILIWYFRRRSG